MTKLQRTSSLLPESVPKWIRVYDNGGKSFDRFTVVFTHAHSFKPKDYPVGWSPYLAMSTYPFHPQGFGQHGEGKDGPIDKPTYGHLGKKIKFGDLPEDCKRLVLSDYKAWWQL